MAFEDIPYAEIDKFHYLHFGKNPDPNYPGGAGLGMDKETFLATEEQIIRGWLKLISYEELLVGKASESRPNSDLGCIPPQRESYLQIFVKGHALKKSIFCEWCKELIFHCEMDRHNNIAGLIKDERTITNPDSFLENRFVAEQKFYYYDERKKKWICKKFSEFAQIERMVRSDTGSTNDCNRNG